MSTVNRRTFLKTGAVGAAGLSFCGPHAAVRAQQPKAAQAAQAPPVDEKPLLRLEAGGPTTFVTSLAFSPDGRTLYAAGFDKVVRVWKLQDGRFTLDKASYRVPIGPGLNGAINAIALSPDGALLAAAGRGVMRGEAGFRQEGMVVPQIGGMTAEMRADLGTIFVFDIKAQTMRRLRGHLGPVEALTFAPAREGKPAILVSAAREGDGKKHAGAIRVWNAADGKEIDNLGQLPEKPTRPSLVVWHTGDELKQLRVVFAWDDGVIRLWDVGQDQLTTKDDGKYNLTLGYLPDQGKVVSGSTTRSNNVNIGHLRLWGVRGGAQLQKDDQEVTFPADDGGSFFPRAMTLLSLTPGGPADHAAVVFRIPEKGDRYELQIIDLSADNFGKVKGKIPLWKGGENIPVLAVASRGAHLAVGGNDQHEIKVFPIPELVKEEPKLQSLKSAGSSFRGIAFVKKNNDLALALRSPAAEEPGRTIGELKEGDLIFDFTRRSLLADQTGWNIDAPAAGDWQASLADVEKTARGRTIRQAIVLRKGNEERRRITLKRLYEVTSFAVLSPRGPATVPILALAFIDDLKQPYLFLYNAETGEQIRQYTGHTDPIRALAFSSDGRLLASTADDQTVCVWSLTSLPKHIGQRGLLPSLAIKEEDGKLIVGKVDEDTPAGKKVERGDVVEGLVENNQVRKLKSPVEFYEAVSQRKPGQEVTVQVAGKGAIAIPVGQYIDQLNALLFLFITAAEKVAAREWIGWNPDGQFDASDRKTERLIGWHFNKGKDENSPPAFAFAEQYRKEYFREGILKHLIATGSLSQALKAWEKEDKAKDLPKPKMVFWIDEEQAAGQKAKPILGPDPTKADDQGRFIVQKRDATLRMSIYDFPANKIDSVRWGLKGEDLQPFVKDPRQEYFADLAPILTAPGEYKIRLVLHTDEQETREYTRDLTIRFQQAAPPAKRDVTRPVPKLVLTKPAPESDFYEEEGKPNPEVDLVGTLDLPNNQKFDAIVLVQDADGKDEIKVDSVVKGETLTAKVTLKYKHNRIKVLLSNEWNDPALAAETHVRYLRPPRILAVDAPKESDKPLANVAARVYSVLPVSRDQVDAEVNGREIAHDRIQVQKQDANTWKVEIKDVPLDPAKNVVHLNVKNAEAASRQPGTATINFVPPGADAARLAAVVEFLSPPTDTKVTDPELDLRFRVKSAGPLQQVELVRQGKNRIRRTFDLANQQPNAQGYYVFDEKSFPKELKDFPLEAKENILRVEAVNAGGAQYASVVVNYINVPVTLTIDKIVPWDSETLRSGKPIVPRVRSDGSLSVDRSPLGWIKVMGHVTWSKANDSQLKKTGMVRVFVNGFQQIPATLDEPKGKERLRTFTADVLLNRPEGNFIELDLPDIKQDTANRTEFTQGTLKPVKGQRLHLLMVGVGEKDENKLREQAVKALRATTDSQGRSSSPAFIDVRFYGPLTGFVSPEQVYTQLCLVKKTIDLNAPQGSANDVVMVYYLGQETVDGKGHFFRTSASKFDPELQRSAITCDGLSAYFTETLGAQILLLDVVRTASPVSLSDGEAPDRIAKWPDSSYTGVMRYLKRIDKGGAPQDILLADLSDLMPKATESGKALEWGDVLAQVEGKITNDKSLVVVEKFRTPLKGLVVG